MDVSKYVIPIPIIMCAYVYIYTLFPLNTPGSFFVVMSAFTNTDQHLCVL